MPFSSAASAFAVACLSFAATSAPAHAKVIFETAAYTGVDTGEYIVQDIRFIGAAFTLDKSTQITGIGGQFGGYPGGTIFGAIVPLASQMSLPSFAPSDIGSNAIADVVFSLPTVTAVDYTAPLSVELSPGSYAVIFGSGAFGADGWGGLGDQNTPVGSPNYVSYFSFSGTPGARTRMTGSASPSPAFRKPRAGRCCSPALLRSPPVIGARGGQPSPKSAPQPVNFDAGPPRSMGRHRLMAMPTRPSSRDSDFYA
jgi:hypothetical protein